LIFEFRDATDYKPNSKDDLWFESLVENQGQTAWASRAKRRRGRAKIRLGLVPAKVRIGPELEPRAIEIDTSGDAWRLALEE
jgi:hypothetical protein